MSLPHTPNTFTVLQRRTNTTGLDDIQQINKLEVAKLTQNILKIAKTHQSSLIQLNKKLKFYSLFKQQEISTTIPQSTHFHDKRIFTD